MDKPLSERIREFVEDAASAKVALIEDARLDKWASDAAALEARAVPEGYGYGCLSDGGSELDFDRGKWRSRYMDGGRVFVGGWHNTGREALAETEAAAEAARQHAAEEADHAE